MKSRPRSSVAPTAPPTIAAVCAPLFWLLPLVALVPLEASAVVVLLLLLPVEPPELNGRVTWPGQLISVLPVVLLDSIVVLWFKKYLGALVTP